MPRASSPRGRAPALLVLGLSALSLLASVAWALLAADPIPARVTGDPDGRTVLRNSVMETAPGGDVSGENLWPVPVPQSRGGEWIFELFSPPFVRRDGDSGTLSAGEQDAVVPKRSPDATGLVRLLSVQETPFRIRLVGLVGTEGSYTGLFEDLFAGGYLLARAGAVIAEGQIAVVSLSRISEPDADRGRSSRAVIRDLIRDRTITLVEGEKTEEVERSAILQWNDDPDASVELRPGESASIGGSRLSLVDIMEDPVGAIVTLSGGNGKEAVTRMLRLDGEGSEVSADE